MRALLPLALVAALAVGCSSDATDTTDTPDTPAPAATPSATAATTATSATPELVVDSPDDLSSGCVKGNGGRTQRVAVWQPTFTAQGGDVKLTKIAVTGRAVTLFDSAGAFVDAGTRSISDDLPWPVDPSLLPDGAAVFSAIRGTQVREGRTVLPILGVELAPRTTRRGAKLAEVVLTYRTGDGTGPRTVSAPLDVAYPNPGVRCT